MELGIVMAVIAILAAVVVPDLIRLMQNRMTGKAADEILILQDTARAFYSSRNPAIATNTIFARWPGMPAPGTCNITHAGARDELIDSGFMTGGGNPGNPGFIPLDEFLINPWGQIYEFVVLDRGGVDVAGCMFGIVTNIPEDLENYFISLLPQAFCGAAACAVGGPTVPGFSRCCSFISEPTRAEINTTICINPGEFPIFQTATGEFSCGTL